MQVQATNTVDYTTATKDTTKTNKAETTSDVKFDMSKPFDIDSFTFEDYKAIDGDDLRDWLRSSNLSNEEESKIAGLSGMTSYSDDDTLNEVLFDRLNGSYDRGEDFSDFFITILVPIADMQAEIYKPIDYENSLMNPEVAEKFKNDPKNWTTTLSGGGRRTEDYSFKSKDLFDYMNNFPEFVQKVEEAYPGFYKNTGATNQAFNEIIAEYTKRKDEQNATLDAYTRNTKQNLISV